MDSDLEKSSAFQVQFFFFLFCSVRRPIQVRIFLEISERKQRTFANSMDRRL